MSDIVIKKLDAFFSKYPVREYKKGDVIIQAGEEPEGIYYIREGNVRSYWISEEGSEITLNMYKPHIFIPMSWAIAGIENTHYYEAMNDVKLSLAPKDVFLDFLKNEPEIIYDLLKRIYVGMHGLWTHLESLAAGNSYMKLINSLVILARRFGKEEKLTMTIQLKMNERNISNYAGMSRETASRELQKLKKNNLVSFQKGIFIIKDIHKLENMLLH